MDEGGRYFEGESLVQKTLRRIGRRLDELGIPYAVAGGMALFAHGFERFTHDVDILVTRDDLRVIHAKLEGLGYVPPFTGSKNLRDAEHGVRIEFLVAGEFPGDGKPKPVAFPKPEDVSVVIDGIRFLSLPKLVELKLASGMTSADCLDEGFRRRDRSRPDSSPVRRVRQRAESVRPRQVPRALAGHQGISRRTGRTVARLSNLLLKSDGIPIENGKGSRQLAWTPKGSRNTICLGIHGVIWHWQPD